MNTLKRRLLKLKNMSFKLFVQIGFYTVDFRRKLMFDSNLFLRLIARLTILLSFFILCTNNSLAATTPYAQDTGTITTMYTSPSGDISFVLSNNFANAVSTAQCPASIGWAGNATMSNILKAALIAAKSNNLTITVTTSGCEGVTWFKILDIYW